MDIKTVAFSPQANHTGGHLSAMLVPTHTILYYTILYYTILSTTVFLHGVFQLLVTASVAPSSLILSIPMMEPIRSSETSVPTRATRRNILDNGILHSHRRENLRSYIALTSWAR
jgi:hypothetical protein